jgi:hypothetical protein
MTFDHVPFNELTANYTTMTPGNCLGYGDCNWLHTGLTNQAVGLLLLLLSVDFYTCAAAGLPPATKPD